MDGPGCSLAVISAFVLMLAWAVAGALAYTGIISLAWLLPWE